MTWIRSQVHSLDWGQNQYLLASVPNGQTLVRIRFQWGFWGVTSADDPTAATATNLAAFGIATQSDTAGTTPPSPYSHPNDVAAPLARWVYYEARFPIIMGQRDGSPGAVQWRDSGQGGPLSTEGMVTASVGVGHVLNVYASWDTAAAWTTSGRAQYWMWASVLYE